MSETDELSQIWNQFQNEVEDKRVQITDQYRNRDPSEFPDHVSITTAFDEILSCFSLGGQVKHYYRYGSYSTCKQQREKFWFAVTNGKFSTNRTEPDWNNIKDLEQRTRIQQFFKQRLLEQKAMGSSEDIWDVRETKLDHPFVEERN